MLLLVDTAVQPLGELLSLVVGEVVPSAVADHPGVGQARRFPSGGRSSHLKELLDLNQAAIRDLDALPVAPLAQLDQQLDDRILDGEGLRGLGDGFQVRLSQAQGSLRGHILGGVGQEHGQLLFILQSVDPHADDEAIVERLELGLLGHLVTGADDAAEGHLDALVTRVELTLVQDREHRVEDGTVGLERLVDEGHTGSRHVAVVDAAEDILLQALEGNRAEDLLRHAELRQQALEVADLVGEAVLQPAGEEALGRSGRAEEERVLAGDSGEQEHAGVIATTDEAALEMFAELLEFNVDRHGGDYLELLPRALLAGFWGFICQPRLPWALS